MHRPRRPAVVFLAVSILLGTQSSAALEFDMLFQTKCVMEEINRGVLVVGDFAAFEKEHPDRPVEMDIKARFAAPQDLHWRIVCASKYGISLMLAITSEARWLL